MKAESIYIHIPFCIQKCIYCDFFSVIYDESTAKKYVETLCKELFLKKDSINTIRTIYIGGGTPSVLPDVCFKQLFQCLRNNFHFSPSAEITVEINPGTVNESKIYTMLSCGVNRVSIGVQSLNDTELKTLGRIHTAEDSIRSIKLIKNQGIRNFSIDLIYAIPGQTMESWNKSLSMITGLSPTHISAYELTLEENTPLYKLIKSKENNPPSPLISKAGTRGLSHKIKMPDEDLILEMYNHATNYLSSCGYDHYEISNFALPAFRCIHNLNYWDRGEYIGVGAGAHSFINDVRSRNTLDINKYIGNLNEGLIPEEEPTKLNTEDSLNEFIFLGLRKTEGININKVPALTPPWAMDYTGVCNNLIDASKDIIDEGYLKIENGFLKLTGKGIVISNTIIVRLFEKLQL